METKKKFKMEMPSTCALLFMLTIFAAVLTWIIPAGEFDTEKAIRTAVGAIARLLRAAP